MVHTSVICLVVYDNHFSLDKAYAASQKLSEEEVLQKGMEAKVVEFVKQGAEIYRKE